MFIRVMIRGCVCFSLFSWVVLYGVSCCLLLGVAVLHLALYRAPSVPSLCRFVLIPLSIDLHFSGLLSTLFLSGHQVIFPNLP